MLRKTLKLLFTLSVFGLASLFLASWFISKQTEKKVYDEVASIPYNKVGLVLGTSQYLAGGRKNLYFYYRMEAAVKLYQAGKISYLIVSGDNRHQSYNEPEAMKNELVKRGIPEKVIFLDYAGLRTLDSVVRCKEIFGQDKFTIISQKFHNERAIFIAKKYEIDAIGFNAKDVSTPAGLKTKIREYFARVKVFMDIYVLNKKPKFLGEPVQIP